ncbi:hypothetical protein GIB67_031506 [Kingdonia uniflora]|uniref:Uncharacterized protein n=1 Tax=Kingdonia uniflora TaxID=39325 RepID=A0A7J7MN54_9MAGN|nr:hypothetical protein GIB67_031506 [Kingdonia uniflora]
MVYEDRVSIEMQKLKLRYFGDQSLEMPTPVPVSPTYQGEQRWRCLCILVEDKVEETDAGVSVTAGQFCRCLTFGLSESSNNGVNKAPTTPTSRVSKLSRGVTKSDPSSPSPQPNSRLSIDRSPRSVESKLAVDRKSSGHEYDYTRCGRIFSGEWGRRRNLKWKFFHLNKLMRYQKTELPSESGNGNPKDVCQSVQGEAEM